MTALTHPQLEQAKIELGYNGLTLSALPYALDGVTQIFEQIVGPYADPDAVSMIVFYLTQCTAVANPIRNPFNHLFRPHRGTSEKTVRLAAVAEQGARTFRRGNESGFDAKKVAEFEREFPHR